MAAPAVEPEEDEAPSKRQKTNENDDITKHVFKVVDAQGQSGDEDEDEDMDMEDIAEFMD